MTTKRELLQTEERVWHELRDRFAAVHEWEKPGVSGDWCAKDVLAHVSCWQAQVADWLEAWRASGTKPGEVDFQGSNDDFYDRCRELALHDVQVMSGAARHRAREELGHMEEPISKGWVRAIETCLQEHYEEHFPDLDAFLAKGSE